MTTPDSTPRPATGRTRAATVHVVSCGYCDQGGEFETRDHVARFKDQHFEWTGHDNNWFEITTTKEIPVARPRLRSEVMADYLRHVRTPGEGER